MARYSQRAYFGDAPDRLQNGLDLDGILSLELETGIRPVVLVGDYTGPGYNKISGRRFSMSQATAAAGRYGLACTTSLSSRGIIVNQLVISARVANGIVWWKALTVAQALSIYPGLVSGAPNGLFTESPDGSSPPAVIGIGAVGGVAVPTPVSGKANCISGGNPLVVQVDVFLAPGQALDVAAVGATTEIDVTFIGRVL